MAAKKKAKKKVAKKKTAKKHTLTKRTASRKPKTILPQHKIFCDHLRASPNYNVVESYMKAFPKCNSKDAASSGGYKVLARLEVQEYMNEKRAIAEEKVDITQEQVLKDLMELRDMCMGKKKVPVAFAVKDEGIITGEEKQFNASGAKGALELLGKTLKMFTDKVDHSGNVIANFNFDTGPKE